VTGAEFRGVDIDLLADYIGGALTGTPDESAVAALIADDPAWRAAYESLGGGMAAVRAELGRFEPEPMPADVADRLTEALAAAPHLTLVSDPEPVPERRPARSARRRRWVTPIAIAAGTVALVGFSLDYISGRASTSSNDSASSAGLAETDSRAQKDAAAAGTNFMVLASGTDYSKSTLADPVPQPLSAASSAEAPQAPHVATPDRGVTAEGPLGRLHIASALAACLDEIATANGAGEITTESVDFARFDGAPAVVVRFSANNGVWVWASGAACGSPGDGPATLASVPVR